MWDPGQKGFFLLFLCRGVRSPVSKAWPFILLENPPPFFTGVVAGTKDYRKWRWQSVGGKDKVAQVVSGTDVLDSAFGSSGKTESVTVQSGAELEVLCSSNEDNFSSVLSEVCCPGETCSDDALFEVPCGENDLDGAALRGPALRG